MKKNNLYFSALVLFLGLSFANCHSSSGSSGYLTTGLLVNYINTLLSGNCAQIQKLTSSSSVVTYSATGYNVPSGGCNTSTLGSTYYTSTSAIITVTDAYFTSIATTLANYPACSVMASVIAGSTTSSTLNTSLATSTFFGSTKTATTATALATLIAANTADSANGPKNCYNVKITSLNTIGVTCAATTDVTTALANIGYYVVSDVTSDMATSVEGNRTIIKGARAVLTSSSTSYDTTVALYTPTAIAAVRPMTSTELTTFKTTATLLNTVTYGLVAGLYSSLASTFAGLSFSSNAPSCLSAITASSATTKDYLIRVPALQNLSTPFFNTDIVSSNKLAVTTPLIPTLACVYGDTATTTATSASYFASTPAIGTCPSTYTKF